MADIQKFSVYDSRIVQKAPKYAVRKGGLAVTNAPFQAIAKTASQLSWNIQVPSLSVFFDRAVEWRSIFRVSALVTYSANPGAGVPVARLGADIAIAPFPLMSLITTLVATINSTSVSVNLSDVLYEVLRLVDDPYNSQRRTTPSMLDTYANYADGNGAFNSPLTGYRENQYDRVPNGAFNGVRFVDPNNGASLAPGVPYTFNGVTTAVDANGLPVTTNAQLTDNIGLEVDVTEPLLLSPFIFNESCTDETAFFGINNVQLVANVGADRVQRVVRNNINGTGGVTRTVSNVQFVAGGDGAFSTATIDVVYITPSLDLPLPATSVVEYMEYPRYITSSQSLGTVGAGATATLRSQTITLPVVPDALVIYAKPSSFTPQQGDAYLSPRSINITFDNYSGLGSTYSTTQLFKISANNGLRQDWNSWFGEAVAPGTATNKLQTTGGFLVLRPGTDFALASGVAPGVLGSFTLQLDMGVQNTSSAPVAPNLYIMTINSGYFQTQAGSSVIQRGLLSESDVINAPMASAGDAKSMERLVGSGLFSGIGSALQRAGEMAMGLARNPAVRGVVKDMARKSGVPVLAKMADVAEMAGLGQVTGGRRRMANMRNLM